MSKSDTVLFENMTVPLAQIGDISTAFQRLWVNARDMITANDAETIKVNVDKINERKAEIDSLSNDFEQRIISDEMKTAFQTFQDARKDYESQLDSIITLATENRDAEAIALMAETRPAGIASRAEQDAITKIVAMKVDGAKAQETANSDLANSVITTMTMLMIGGTVFAIALGLFLSMVISRPLKKAAHMIKEIRLGHLGERLNMDTRDEIGEMSIAMDEMADDLQNKVIGTMNMISEGDVSADIEIADDQDEITPAIKKTIETIQNLIAEATMLSQAAVAGQLDARGHADAFNGGFKEIVQGVNQTLDAVVGPLNVAAEYVERISQGDIPAKITDNYNGDFNAIKNNLNTCIDAVNALVADAGMLEQAGVAGRLSTRADASRHHGDFARIVNGVNATLDAVVAPVQEASATLNELAKGNLNTGMVSQYQGDYTVIKDDMNQTVAFLKRYVDEITHTLEEIGRGNLDQHITDDYLGDFQAIKTALNEITSSLSTTMSDINMATGQVEIGSQQISSGGQALSQGTTEQASSIQELTASIEEVAGETKRNAVNANQANELAMRVRSNAELGNSQMNKMVAAMVDINESSKSISKIIKVIDDIAFQTNILALNAAVEAARAGQHGKGFAVVAEEVRTLAARSAEAAKETTGLIEGSIDKVEAGTKIADQTEESLKEILHEIEQVTDLVGNIARAFNDQASEIAQINQGIEQVSTVVQTNSATAEESAAASEELSGQAEMLKQMVDAFKIKNTKTQGSTAKPVVSKPEQPISPPPMAPSIDLDNDMDKY